MNIFFAKLILKLIVSVRPSHLIPFFFKVHILIFTLYIYYIKNTIAIRLVNYYETSYDSFGDFLIFNLLF